MQPSSRKSSQAKPGKFDPNLLCFKGAWILSVLHSGLGIPFDIAKPDDIDNNGTDLLVESAKEKGFIESNFQSMDEINGVELSWTLGKMVLHASAQLPTDIEFAVGFGPSTGSAADFHTEVSMNGPLGDVQANTSGAQSYSNSLFIGGNPVRNQPLISTRRLPGLVMFLVIFLFLGCLMAGRVWRRKFFYGVTPKKLFAVVSLEKLRSPDRAL